jgi:signal transduction histidine kinase
MISSDLIRVLLIEDNVAEARLLQEILKGSQPKQFSWSHVQRLKDGLAQLQKKSFEVILLDLTLPDSQGLASVVSLVQTVPQLPIVVLTNTNDDKLALESLRCGAQDYLVKRQVNLDLLVRSLCYAIERKQTEEALRETKKVLEVRVQERTAELIKAKELNQLKNEFVSMLSHDFRNPLNTILLSAGLLEDSRDRLTKEQQISYFRMIRTAIKDMDQLLTEVLLIGRADSGRLLCQFEAIDLEYFCKRMVESFQLSNIEKHQIILTTQGNLQEGLWDETLLRHILTNLIGNAIKYSPQGGIVHFTVIAEAEQMIFRIQDQGVGIPPEDLKNLFNPFYRGSNVDAIPGTGLGLAIVQRCVEAHQGTISIESQVEIGTTFTLIFPIISDE